jgi:dihydropteroate synthase
MRTLIRPTGFVDSPFGHDGKVARLAGGLNWFGLVELIKVEGHARVATDIVPVE